MIRCASTALLVALPLAACTDAPPADTGRSTDTATSDTATSDTATSDTGDADCPPEDRIDWALDADGDGYPADGEVVSACEAPSEDHVERVEPLDCDDAEPTIFPGAPELCWDRVDNDCDGEQPTCATPADGAGLVDLAYGDFDELNTGEPEYAGLVRTPDGRRLVAYERLWDTDTVWVLDAELPGAQASFGDQVVARLTVPERDGQVTVESWLVPVGDEVQLVVQQTWRGPDRTSGQQIWLEPVPETGVVALDRASDVRHSTHDDGDLLPRDAFRLLPGVFPAIAPIGEASTTDLVVLEAGDPNIPWVVHGLPVPDGAATVSEADARWTVTTSETDGPAEDRELIPRGAFDVDADGRLDLLLSHTIVVDGRKRDVLRVFTDGIDGEVLATDADLSLDADRLLILDRHGADVDGDGAPDLLALDRRDGPRAGVVLTELDEASGAVWEAVHVTVTSTDDERRVSALESVGDLDGSGQAELVAAHDTDDGLGNALLYDLEGGTLDVGEAALDLPGEADRTATAKPEVDLLDPMAPGLLITRAPTDFVHRLLLGWR